MEARFRAIVWRDKAERLCRDVAEWLTGTREVNGCALNLLVRTGLGNTEPNAELRLMVPEAISANGDRMGRALDRKCPACQAIGRELQKLEHEDPVRVRKIGDREELIPRRIDR